MAFRRSGVRPSLAPPRFLTNLGIPAEDIVKMAAHRAAILVFGKRAKSPTNLGVFEVAPSCEHTSAHTSRGAESRSVRIRRAPEIGPDLLQSSLSPHFHRSVTYSPLSHALSNGCERRLLQSDISLQRESILEHTPDGAAIRLAKRDAMNRSRERKRCLMHGLPIPEWAAIRQPKNGNTPPNVRETSRRLYERKRCKRLGLPIPEWAALRRKNRSPKNENEAVSRSLPKPEGAASEPITNQENNDTKEPSNE